METRQHHITEFYNAPDAALFAEDTVAHLIGKSKAKLQRDRWEGGGIPFLKMGRSVRYRKSDVLEWLAQFELKQSTSA
jgi:excisionase family DNA binding protein